MGLIVREEGRDGEMDRADVSGAQTGGIGAFVTGTDPLPEHSSEGERS
jgi:hypothetical protein